MKELYPCGWVVKVGLAKFVVGSIRGSDDGRATFAESNTNFNEGIFHMIASELPASSWRILKYQKRVLRMNPLSDRCKRCYFICKQFFEFWNFWSEVLGRTWRSLLHVVCGLQVGVRRIVCFCSGWSHSAHRGRTTKLWVISAGD